MTLFPVTLSRSIFRSLSVAISISLASSHGALGASGDLDPTFGVNGVSSVNMGQAAHTPTGFVAQADGKYLVSFEAPVNNGGGAIGGTPAGSVPFGGGVARFNTDHTLDTSWGYLGIAGRGTTINGIALSNGQLLTIESGILPSTVPSLYNSIEFPFVARYNANGIPDLGFGSDGGRTLPVLTDDIAGYQQRFNAIAIAPDGKIVVVGSDQGQVFVARFRADGTPDSAFGSNLPPLSGGWMRFTVGAGPNAANAVAIQADGRIVVAGSYGPDVSTTRAFVARLTASGSPDPDFAFGGTLSFPTPGDPSDCRSVTIDATRIVAGCTTGITGGKDLYIWGMTLSGATDPTFASTLIDLGSTQDKMFAMFKHPDGRFIAAGRGGAGNSQLAVIAVDANGGRASAFGTNGVFLAPESDTGDGGAIGWNGNEIVAVSRRTVAVQDDAVTTALSTTGARTSVTYSTLSFSYGDYIRPKVLADGRILAIGNMSFGTKGAFRVSRFLPGGSLDATFGGGGHTSFFTEDNWTWGARDFVLQPDGNIVLTGGFGAQPPLSPEQTLGAARVLGNGGLDPAFNAGPSAGQSSFVVPNTFNASAGRAVRLQGDGKILLASRYVPASAAGREMLAVRFNADGTRDTGYGINGLATSAFVIGATQCRAMDLDGNGRAVLMGDGAGEVRLTRFTTSGTLDPSFGTGGMAAFPLPARHSLLFAAAMGFVLPNGKILAVLNASKGTDGEVGLMQANANGTLDTTFGNGGFSFVTVSPGTANNGNAFHAAIAPNGRIAIVGFGSLGTVTYVPMLARFMPDGRPDSSFGSGGVRFYALPADSWLIGVAFAADGSMILTGSTSAGGRIFANVIKTVADGNAIGPNLVNAFSRKHHAGQSGAFDLRLDPVAGISGPIFVEPRASGMGHTIVFRFDTTIASVGSTTVEDANGISLGNPTPVFSGNEVSILLPPIADMTRAKVRATGVNGLASVEVNVGFLFGDITGSRKINAADISAIKRRMGQSITAGDNFAYDVNTNGSIDGVDLSIVKWRSGKLLPLLAVD